MHENTLALLLSFIYEVEDLFRNLIVIVENKLELTEPYLSIVV